MSDAKNVENEIHVDEVTVEQNSEPETAESDSTDDSDAGSTD